MWKQARVTPRLKNKMESTGHQQLPTHENICSWTTDQLIFDITIQFHNENKILDQNNQVFMYYRTFQIELQYPWFKSLEAAFFDLTILLPKDNLHRNACTARRRRDQKRYS